MVVFDLFWPTTETKKLLLQSNQEAICSLLLRKLHKYLQQTPYNFAIVNLHPIWLVDFIESKKNSWVVLDLFFADIEVVLDTVYSLQCFKFVI